MESTVSKDMPSVAVIGTGYWGKNLVRNFHQIGALKMICDKNETVLGALQAQHPGVEICLALTDVLKRDDIQGVVIATPAETHFYLAREALLAGKHVFVEKPLVLNESEGRELIDIAEKQRPGSDGRAPAAVPPGLHQAQRMCIFRRTRADQLHLLASPEFRENPAGRKHPLVLCPARYFHDFVPGGGGAGEHP